MAELIEFIATLPPIQSAVMVSGDHNGMRIKLDVPESEVGNAVRLMLLSGKLFKVTIEDISESLTVLDDEIEKSAKGNASGLDSGRVDLRRSKQQG